MQEQRGIEAIFENMALETGHRALFVVQIALRRLVVDQSEALLAKSTSLNYSTKMGGCHTRTGSREGVAGGDRSPSVLVS